MNFLSNYQKKERWAGDISQHDEDGWMFYPDRLCFDDIDSAYAQIERVKEVAEYGRQIHSYPAK
jgi:hypothetical protein